MTSARFTEPRPIAAWAILELVADAEDAVPFEDVLCYSCWWDCPRSGVALVAGQPYYFDCQFSEELDDYPERYVLWPAPEEELADDIEARRMLADWRGRFDSGIVTTPFPRPTESAVLAAVCCRRQRQPPDSARTAIPEWRLDRNRSFAGRVPVHRVRWIFV